MAMADDDLGFSESEENRSDREALRESKTFKEEKSLEPIIFSSKQKLKSAEVTSSHVIYEVDDLERTSIGRATELMQRIPGVEVSQTGVTGGEASIYIRGAEARHTLILIDGVKFYDPSSIGRTLNVATLNTLDIERIEVLKGAQSVLYGSDAIGGVINIITKKGRAKDSVKFSTGYYNELALENSFSFKDTLLYLNAYYQDTAVESEALDEAEKDANVNRGFTGSYSFDAFGVEFETLFKMVDNYAEVDRYDYSNYTTDDDRNAYGKDKSRFFNQKAMYQLSDSEKIKANLNYHKYERVNKTYNQFDIDYDTYNYYGSVLGTEVSYNKDHLNGHETLGIDYSIETYEDDSDEQFNSSYFDVFYMRDLNHFNMNFDLGSRLTHNEDFGSHIVYHAGVKKEFVPKHFIGLNNKTGFKAPSVYQLKAPESNFGKIGNEDLGPEKSNNYEVNYEYRTSDKLFTTSVFYNEVKDFIGFGSEGYENTKGAIYRGLEVSFDHKMTKREYGINASYTTYKLSSALEATRRPDYTLTTYYLEKINDIHSVLVDLQYKGLRFDNGDPNKDQIELDPYTILNVDYQFQKNNFDLIVSVKNITDEEYELATGYTTLGRNFQLTGRYNY